ncbi:MULTISPECIES: AlpA family transcriptional regulator [Halorhodospira]|uniref:helix-turn-helix transcriptional regulator n=1 Tax=Halorhodospira TaxID=85108 RepID=UPI002102EC28|nr:MULTISPECIES: helix-turn-helix domain-containing protein [Halorhodospira]
MRQVLYIDDVAERMGMSRDALRSAVKRGHVPRPGRIGRRWAWDRIEFEEWLGHHLRQTKRA